MVGGLFVRVCDDSAASLRSSQISKRLVGAVEAERGGEDRETHNASLERRRISGGIVLGA